MATYKFNKDTGKIEKKQDDQPAYVKAFLPQSSWRILSGKRRRSSPQAHSNPSHGTSPGAGRTFTASPQLGPVTPADYSNLFTIFPEPDPVPPTIPYAGIRTGEIIGERFWWIKRQGLTSMSRDYIWGPGCTVGGETNEIVFQRYSYFIGLYEVLYGGIYSFHPSYEEIVREEANFMHYIYEFGTEIADDPRFPLGLAQGKIKMWGDVVEHEKGYRAQFAKLISIDKFISNPHDPACKEWCHRIVSAHREAANAPSPTLPRT